MILRSPLSACETQPDPVLDWDRVRHELLSLD